MYILTLLLNIVTSRTEALVATGKKCLHSCANEVYHLCAQSCFDTVHQLPIIVEVLRSQPFLSVCKQPSLEMLQQWSSAKSCMQTCIVREANYVRCPHSMPLVLHGPIQSFRVLQYTFDVTVVPCCMNSTENSCHHPPGRQTSYVKTV
jgi:hypothetical protein